MNDKNRAGEIQIAWQSLTAAMLAATSVRAVKDIADVDRGPIYLPERAGVYAFWWTGRRQRLMEANRHIVLKDPGANLSMCITMIGGRTTLRTPACT